MYDQRIEQASVSLSLTVLSVEWKQTHTHTDSANGENARKWMFCLASTLECADCALPRSTFHDAMLSMHDCEYPDQQVRAAVS